MDKFEYKSVQAPCQGCNKLVMTETKRKLRGVDAWKKFYWNYCACICCVPVAFCPTKKHRAFNTIEHRCPECKNLIGRFTLRSSIKLQESTESTKNRSNDERKV